MAARGGLVEKGAGLQELCWVTAFCNVQPAVMDSVRDASVQFTSVSFLKTDLKTLSSLERDQCTVLARI